MKKPLTFALALMVLAAFTGLGVAQQKGEEQKAKVRGAFEETKTARPRGEGVKLDEPVLQRMTGKVIRDNQSGKTFTVMANGKEVTFNAAKLKVLPKVGEIIDITYTGNPGGPMEAVKLNSSKSNIY